MTVICVAYDTDVASLGPPPAWDDPLRATYDALVAIIRFERKHGYPRGVLIKAICEPVFFGDPDDIGKAPLTL